MHSILHPYEVTWGKKISIFDKRIGLEIEGFFTEFDEVKNLVYITPIDSSANETSYDANDIEIRVKKSMGNFKTFNKESITQVLDRHKYKSGTILYSSDRETWKEVPSDHRDWDKRNWTFIFIEV